MSRPTVGLPREKLKTFKEYVGKHLSSDYEENFLCNETQIEKYTKEQRRAQRVGVKAEFKNALLFTWSITKVKTNTNTCKELDLLPRTVCKQVPVTYYVH